MNKLLFVFIVFTVLPNSILAQQPVRRTIKGKVIADANNLDGIYVVNLKTDDGTITQSSGYFSLPVEVGDTLMLSSIQFKGIKIGIKEEDIAKELFFVKMQPLMHELKEVMVFQYKNINAVALGIIPKGTKSYTPAERKLNAASNPYFTGLSASVDPLLNLFSGRTAMLKKELMVERKESVIHKIENMFERDYFIDRLKIPEEYVKGFHFYLVENNRFVALINAKNKAMATFMMGELAVKYLEIIACEK
jgi:hypothetical protein